MIREYFAAPFAIISKASELLLLKNGETVELFSNLSEEKYKELIKRENCINVIGAISVYQLSNN